jgi:hypothetical protein
MDFEKFREFMLESAATHDAEIATIRQTLLTIRDSFASMEKTAGMLLTNQIHLQESMDGEHKATAEAIQITQEEIRTARADTKAELAELSRIVFGHITDPDAHKHP